MNATQWQVELGNDYRIKSVGYRSSDHSQLLFKSEILNGKTKEPIKKKLAFYINVNDEYRTHEGLHYITDSLKNDLIKFLNKETSVLPEQISYDEKYERFKVPVKLLPQDHRFDDEPQIKMSNEEFLSTSDLFDTVKSSSGTVLGNYAGGYVNNYPTALHSTLISNPFTVEKVEDNSPIKCLVETIPTYATKYLESGDDRDLNYISKILYCIKYLKDE